MDFRLLPVTHALLHRADLQYPKTYPLCPAALDSVLEELISRRQQLGQGLSAFLVHRLWPFCVKCHWVAHLNASFKRLEMKRTSQ